MLRQRTSKEAIRLDKLYLEWLKRQPSCYSGRFSEWHSGIGYSIPAHVRRAGEAGTGYKPLFSAIPLSDAEHKLTHQHGDSVLRSPEWFNEKRAEYLERWLQTQPSEVREIVESAKP